jgi:hypothetical protein
MSLSLAPRAVPKGPSKQASCWVEPPHMLQLNDMYHSVVYSKGRLLAPSHLGRCQVAYHSQDLVVRWCLGRAEGASWQLS